ncbi:MAG: 1-deoxy-D-xylulose-5-phosphate synthase [Clostridia bacterium]|nr:1-deoxy-D-xylulose-5-phosphate synthase [Clostridia bacterium]
MESRLEDLKSKKVSELGAVCGEIRGQIIDAVSKNGGHLASNLGIIEATVALHYVFNSPKDKIIFDVGHQCYAHKILTGRDKELSTLRQLGGLSGFTSRQESRHDVFYEGHSGASISAALGIAEANRIKGDDSYTVAVIGDGSVTNGMVYEALNNCNNKQLRLIILINDNEMSISKNVGGMHNHFSKIRTSKKYFGFKRGVEKGLVVIPLIGKPLARFVRWLKNGFKRIFVKKNIFEDLGLSYIGPADGNNVAKVVALLNEAKRKRGPVVVHVTTKKGFGYAPAQKNPELYHATGPFDKKKGKMPTSEESFSTVMGKHLATLAKKDDKICAITAAMGEGTGLCHFEKEHPKRFFDVGIAEEHAITFSAGLSQSGMKPVVSLYSTFAQRVYDQVLHDVAIQRLPFTLLLDRAGLVPQDGITHQGIFDVSIFSSIPDIRIYSPEKYEELRWCLDTAIEDNYLDIIRYPKGTELCYEPALNMVRDNEDLFEYSENIDTCNGVIITYGRVTKVASDAIKALEGQNIGLIKLIRICPINLEKIKELTRNAGWVYLLEESFENGCVMEKIGCGLENKKIKLHAVKGFMEHGTTEELYNLCGFNVEAITKNIKNL